MLVDPYFYFCCDRWRHVCPKRRKHSTKTSNIVTVACAPSRLWGAQASRPTRAKAPAQPRQGPRSGRCPAALPPAPRRGRPGQADIEMRLQAPLSRPPPAAQRLSPACSEPDPPNLQVLSTDLRLQRARSRRHRPADYGNLELAAEGTGFPGHPVLLSENCPHFPCLTFGATPPHIGNSISK